MGPRSGLDRSGKSRPHQDSIPGPSSPWPVAIPATLPGSHGHIKSVPKTPGVFFPNQNKEDLSFECTFANAWFWMCGRSTYFL